MNGETPDLVEPVVGWRAWRVEPGLDGSRLRSVTRSDLWPVGDPLTARCAHGIFHHDAPGVNCRCGVYAARDPRDAAFYTSLPSNSDQSMAIGMVALWGTVIEGEAGWRASHAYPERVLVVTPRAMIDLGSRLEVAAGLGDYRVPVELLDVPRSAITGEVILDWETSHPGVSRTF